VDLRCFVKVLPGADGKWPGGTGYLISRDRVLTAAHVVRSADEGAIAHDDAAGTGAIRCSTQVQWRGDGDCDIAVLKLPEPVTLDLPIAAVGDTPLDARTQWESRGWALAAPKEKLVRDSLVSLLGEASAFQAEEKRFQLTVEQFALEVSWWRGVSGAPVFAAAGSRRILGVIAEAPAKFSNVLHATPLTRAFRDPKFAEALGPPVVFKRRDELSARVSAILRGAPPAAQAIAERKEPWREAYAGVQPDRLAEKLLAEADVAETLTALLRAHGELWSRPEAAGRGAAEAIERILLTVGPLLVLRRVLHALPNAEGAVCLSLPVSTRSFAELAIAGYSGQPARWKPECLDEPDGLGRIPLPGEAGFDVTGEVAIGDYERHFRDSVLLPADRERLDRLRSRYPNDPERVRTETFALTADELEFRATSAGAPLRSYLVYEREWANRNDVLLRDLRRKVPSIHYIELTGDDYRGERKIWRIFRELLTKKRKPPEDEDE
jgi:hypothetical protein